MAHEVRGVIARSKGTPVSVETIHVPDPGPGEVVVDIQACGVCHTDLHYREGAINDEFPFLLGHEAGPFEVEATLTEPLAQTGARETFHPACLKSHPGQPFQVAPLPWKGSADQRAFSMGNGLIRTPAHSPMLRAGARVRVVCPAMPYG